MVVWLNRWGCERQPFFRTFRLAMTHLCQQVRIWLLGENTGLILLGAGLNEWGCEQHHNIWEVPEEPADVLWASLWQKPKRERNLKKKRGQKRGRGSWTQVRTSQGHEVRLAPYMTALRKILETGAYLAGDGDIQERGKGKGKRTLSKVTKTETRYDNFVTTPFRG